jgi:hypothetical protein
MQSVGPYEDTPDQYEAPNGVEVMAGVADDAGSRDPSSTSVSGAVTNAMAQQAEIMTDTLGLGSHVGDLVDLPPLPY